MLTDRDKREIRRILGERSLTSHMNDTKWRELCAAVLAELPFPPAYQEKSLFADAPWNTLSFSPDYWGDWGRTAESRLDLATEWIRIAPRQSVPRGALVSPEIRDCSDQLRSILERFNLLYVEEDGFFTVYGHS
ncbi:DUF6678 family protein [Aminobacter ciceronei]|jgi:hypothetical protein|uniref:DUF6678 family protein n=1 Tax=Aminobacter ciceronei TaxID=150723 RepID=UPI003F704162